MKLNNKFVGISNNIKLVCKISFVVIIFLYFLFHSINGENGFISYIKVKKQISEKSEKLDILQSNLKSIQKRVTLLSNKTLDLDMLEERSKTVLNYCYPEEIVIREKQILEN